MAGAYLAHSVYGFFQNGGGLCWIVRVGGDDGGRGRARRRCPAAADAASRRSARSRATASTATSSVEIAEEPSPAEAEGETATDDLHASSSPPARDARSSTGLTRQEGPQLHRHEGQRGLEAGQARGDRRVAARGAPPGDRHATRCRAPAPTAGDGHADAVRGRRRPPRGHGRPRRGRRDHDGLLPDLMTLAENGDDTGARPAGQDDRPLRGRRRPDGDPRRAAGPDAPGRARVAHEHRGLRLEVRDAVLPVARGHGPAHAAAAAWCRRPATWPASGRAPTAPAASTRRPRTRSCSGVNGLGFQVTHEEQGGLNQLGINCIRAFPGRGIRVWGARTLSSDPEWRYLNVRRLFNYVSRVDHGGHAVGRVRAQRRAPLDLACASRSSNFLTRTWREGALFGATPDEAFFVKCDAETNPPDVIEAGQVVDRDRDLRRSSRPSS